MSADDEIVVMVSGPQWVSRDYYVEHYTGELYALAALNTRFVLGAADGIDTYAQEDLAAMCEAGTLDPTRVTIFNKGAKDGRVHSQFALQNGFASYPERDRAMCELSTKLLCRLPQYGGGTGGTALNVLRLAFGGDEDNAQIAHKALRVYSERLDEAQKSVMIEHVRAAYDAVYAGAGSDDD